MPGVEPALALVLSSAFLFRPEVAHTQAIQWLGSIHAGRRPSFSIVTLSALGLAAACGYLNGLGRNAIAEHERTLTAHALAMFRQVKGLTLIGPAAVENRVPVFCFTMAGVPVPTIVRLPFCISTSAPSAARPLADEPSHRSTRGP